MWQLSKHGPTGFWYLFNFHMYVLSKYAISIHIYIYYNSFNGIIVLLTNPILNISIIYKARKNTDERRATPNITVVWLHLKCNIITEL